MLELFFWLTAAFLFDVTTVCGPFLKKKIPLFARNLTLGGSWELIYIRTIVG